MTFVSQVNSKYGLVEQKNLTIYRFIKDVFPLDVTPFYQGNGVYGPCTYFSFEDRTGKSCGAEQYTLHFKYEAKPEHTLWVTPKQLAGLEDADVLTVVEDGFLNMKSGTAFDATLLPKKAKKLKYDAIGITGRSHLEGGRQLLALKPFALKLISFNIIFNDESHRDYVYNGLNPKAKKCKSGIVGLPPAALKKIDQLLRKVEQQLPPFDKARKEAIKIVTSKAITFKKWMPLSTEGYTMIVYPNRHIKGESILYIKSPDNTIKEAYSHGNFETWFNTRTDRIPK